MRAARRESRLAFTVICFGYPRGPSLLRCTVSVAGIARRRLLVRVGKATTTVHERNHQQHREAARRINH